MDAARWLTHSNLQSFLHVTTPWVPSKSLSKTCCRDPSSLYHPSENNLGEFFTLGDLWEQYYEWSVCGAGVPIFLNSRESVVQYYVPYLSAIQIYTSKSLASSRNLGDDSESDSWSDDSENEKLSRSWDGVSEDSAFDHDASWPMKDRIGHLYMQYIERCAPYARIPLANKVYELAQDYPGLLSFKSVEISPVSWMSVAWYPIYHIPTRRNVKDLTTCFLTYHTISSSFQDGTPGEEEKRGCAESGNERRGSKGARSNCISLPPLGLATYKMQGSLWMNHEAGDHDTIVKLYSAADSWLKQLRVHHHDFNFFLGHSM